MCRYSRAVLLVSPFSSHLSLYLFYSHSLFPRLPPCNFVFLTGCFTLSFSRFLLLLYTDPSLSLSIGFSSSLDPSAFLSLSFSFCISHFLSLSLSLLFLFQYCFCMQQSFLRRLSSTFCLSLLISLSMCNAQVY